MTGPETAGPLQSLCQPQLFTQDDAGEGELVGLERPEQLGEVPHDYHGLLLIEDMYDVGRALRR